MKLTTQLFRFGLVGCTALGIHLLTVMHLVSVWRLPPLMANIVGFLVAFQLSYWGHYKWTFHSDQMTHKRALFRFFATACLGFLLNESLYASILHATSLSYDTALFLTLLVTAGSTFLLSKAWAFR